MNWMNDEMNVRKRNGEMVTISFDKILHRIKTIGQLHNIHINYSSMAMRIIDQLYDGIETSKIDELTAQQCASQTTQHIDYGRMASVLCVSNLHRETPGDFIEVTERLYTYKDIHGNNYPMVADDYYACVNENATQITDKIDYEKDYVLDYFGYKTLERAYLFRIDGKIIERPQDMWMRVAIGIHGKDLVRVFETYDLMSDKYFTHATPTLFNAGTPRPQMSSCYLLAMEDDSVDGIYNTLKDCASISKYAGGIGLHIHNVRASGTHIRGTNGTSNGIVPMLRVFNNTARYIDQGGGRRNGSFAIYLEPWHADVFAFLEMRKNHGDEETKARDLFYALWISDLFMKRVETDGKWTLMCPHECPGLSDVYGEEFETLYTKYETEGKGRRTIDARKLWFHILDSQMETGTPYLLYKDAVNNKSNQKNLGTIKSSNLCTEITEFSNHEESAVCNLASIGLPMFVNTKEKTFDYDKLHKVTKVITCNLNRVIDINFYPTDKTKLSNMRHRPIGIGVQGLADVFIMMGLSFNSETSKEINKNIFETIYHASMETSYELALERYNKYGKNKKSIVLSEDEKSKLNKEHIGAYSSFTNSPLFYGKFQFDLWEVEPSDRYDWDDLRQKVMMRGVRNALLVAPMPTASTSQILGNNECFEPITSNIYSRNTLAGEFMVANKHLMKELSDMGMWNEEIKNNIIANKGSVKYIDALSDEVKARYRTVWEIPMKDIVLMAKERGAFICQSQSLNLWQEEPTYGSLTSMHFYAWKQGLKTGVYYLRRKAKHQAQQFTIDPTKSKKKPADDEPCEMCSA
uniref:ribonucleoside-diphosphate reductase n=1 Tax=viral metagenome TaxID=1070528 RepID=A0A6C0LTI4_9ZZZZ